MPRFKLTIEYAGTRYSGWQIQKNAKTVQGEIDRAVRTVTGRKDFELYGSGRTDAGVHAIAQVAHLDVSTSVPAETRAPGAATPPPPPPTASGDGTLATLATEAQRHYERAIQAQRAGDWATYGEELRQLGQVLDRMRAR